MTQHFAVGRRVVMGNHLYIILAYNDQRVVLIPAEVSGYVEVVTPYYTQNL